MRLALPCLTLALALSVAIELYLRFTHPDMTETRLLLNFWWLHLGVLILAGGALVGFTCRGDNP